MATQKDPNKMTNEEYRAWLEENPDSPKQKAKRIVEPSWTAKAFEAFGGLERTRIRKNTPNYMPSRYDKVKPQASSSQTAPKKKNRKR